MHTQVKIGDSIVMFNDEFPNWGILAPTSSKSETGVTLHLYVEDADKTVAAAVAAGAVVTMPLAGPILGRPLWQSEGSVRTYLGDCHAYQGHEPRRDDGSAGRGHGQHAGTQIATATRR